MRDLFHRYTRRQISLLFHLSKKNHYSTLEEQSKMIAQSLDKMLAKAFNGSSL